MYFIVEPMGIIGKTIAYVMTNDFSSHPMFVTDDKGVFIVKKDGHETRILPALLAVRKEEGNV